MKLKSIFLILTTLSCYLLCAQQSAEELLDQSISFHDPNNQWKKLEAVLDFKVERPEKEDGQRKVAIDNKKNAFMFWAYYDEGTLTYLVDGNEGLAKWNDKLEIPEEIAKKYRISNERAIMYRDYYTYLYGMPMKLKDEGTILDPKVERVEFYGKKYDRIRVTYDPKVGEDIWYFYFDLSTHALEAYQFFHEEEKNDGEYILFEGIKVIDGVKIPRNRKWYYNKESKYLATDILVD